MQAAASEGEGQPEVTMTTKEKGRLCPGHERALPIERTVMELDVKDEGKFSTRDKTFSSQHMPFYANCLFWRQFA